MPEQRIKELETQLLAAQGNIAELTKTNATLTASLADADLALKRSRRNARQDGNTLRDEISNLQSRRG
jgi:F0F1-type ATP synthase membrane subunit b/b'